MDEVCLRRTDASVDWGFQVHGGFEHHQPWTMTDVSIVAGMTLIVLDDRTVAVFIARLCPIHLRMATFSRAIC